MQVCNKNNCISTHSLTKRLTEGETGGWIEKEDFNSQPHEEADELGGTYISKKGISTHSLTKRLTTNATARGNI